MGTAQQVPPVSRYPQEPKSQRVRGTGKQRCTKAGNHRLLDYSSRKIWTPDRDGFGFDVAAVIFRRQEATRNSKSRVNAHPSRRSRILVIGFARNLDNVINQSFALELPCARMLVAKFLRPNNSTFGPSPADGPDGGTSARLPIRRSGGAINEATKMQLKLPGDHQPCVEVQAKEERKN